MSIYDYSAASGPPTRKGDTKGVGFGSTVDVMKLGLRAHYAKAGTPIPDDMPGTLVENQRNIQIETQQQTVATSVTKDALKQGLRAWYTKRGMPIHESTGSAGVGDGTARSLGGGFNTRRKELPTGGTSLRADIRALEKSLEKTLTSLSNRKQISDGEDRNFRNLLVDALSRLVLDGDRGYFKDALMHASLIESRFIGDPIPETAAVLTQANDYGAEFKEQMNEEGSMVDMIANQLSSGMPLQEVTNNVVASYNNTTNYGMRQFLQAAHNVLLGMR